MCSCYIVGKTSQSTDTAIESNIKHIASVICLALTSVSLLHSIMEPVLPEQCSWDPVDGFSHQHYCSHSCHGGPTGFGHILVCCGIELVTSNPKCSSRCQRPYNPADRVVDAEDCPNCGPWTLEHNLLCLLEAIEFWFHYFGLLPKTHVLRQHERKLREYQANVLENMGPELTAVYQEVKSIRVLREKLTDEVESRKPDPEVKAKLKPLPITDEEARNWYASPEASQSATPSFDIENAVDTIDDFLHFRNGNLDFYCEGDDKQAIRAELIAIINHGIVHGDFPVENEVNERRLLSLFNRPLFDSHIIKVGYNRPDLVECDKQMRIFQGEQIVARSGGYWNDIEDLAGPDDALTHDKIAEGFGRLLQSDLLQRFQPIFDWLETSKSSGLKFKTGKRLLGFSYSCARELLREYERNPMFGALLTWSDAAIQCFLKIAQILQASPDNNTPWKQTEVEVDALITDLTSEDSAKAESEADEFEEVAL